MPIRRIRHTGNKNPFWAVICSLLSGITGLIISLPLYVPFILFLPTISAFRWLLLKLYKRREDGYYDLEPMSGAEARWMKEGRKSVMHAVLILDSSEGLSMDQFRRIISTRVLPVYPRLTRLPLRLPLFAGSGFCWIPHSQFSISKHLFHGPPSIASKEAAQSYIAQLMHQEIIEGKPPWEFHIISPKGELKDTIIVARIHQSIGDGSELLRVLCHSMSDTPSVDIPERPWFTSFSFGLNVLRTCLTGPCTLLIWLGLTAADLNPLTTRCNTCNGQVTVSWSATVTLPKVMRIKQVTRSSVNCVVLSAIAGALRVLLQGCGMRQPPNIKVLLPVDIRSQNMSKASSRCLGNKNSSITMQLPVSVEGCIPRLWATRRTLSHLSTKNDPILLYLATGAMVAMTPPAVVCYLLHLIANKASLQYSSIAGPTSHMTIGGGRLKEIYCLVPAPARLGLSVSCITYDDQVLLSIAAENELGAAAQALLAQIETQIETLWKLLLNRRVPGENTITCMQYHMPEIVNSPMQEIEERISEIQKEVVRLSAGQQDQELQMLKMEYGQLVGELKRRFSDANEKMKQQRPRSGSLASHLSGSSLKSVLSSNSYHEDETEKHIKLRAKSEGLECKDTRINNIIKYDTSNSIQKKHRKNSFEIIRFYNKRRDVQPRDESFNECLTDNCDENTESEYDEREKETDYCDSVIKISDDECMDTGPMINPTLRDIYCSNYLEHKLEHLRQQQALLTKQFKERTGNYSGAIDPMEGLLI